MFKNMLRKKVLLILIVLIILPNMAFANKIQDSQLGTGINALINDLTSWLPIVAVGVGIVAVIFFNIMKTYKDEMDKKKWSDRIETAIFSTIVAVIASSLLRLVLSYFGYVG